MAPIHGDIMPEQRRLTAIKTDVKSIVRGRFIREEGFTPSYVLSPSGLKLSRVRIMGTVISKFTSIDQKFGSITIDDGTETIRAKIFQAVSMFNNIEKGDIVDIIGKIRLYEDEIYVVPEILWKVDDPNLWLLRKVELLKQKRELEKVRKLVFDAQKQTSDVEELKRFLEKKYGINPELVESILMAQEEKTEEEFDMKEEREKIIKLIEQLDEGNGCEYSKLIEASGLPEDVLETIINELLSDGTCFEPRPGFIKLL